uniref:C2H2-type domain-containing protein n=1 Tax=Erpetoichthys calabaricus TaxID=27687 RepID=A0A8C4TFF2_ERPCA
MTSAREDHIGERLAHVKQENCEWGALEGLCVKVEDCEERVSVFKEEECKEESVEVKVEDLEDVSVGLEFQKHGAGHPFKVSVYENPQDRVQPWVTNTGRLATQQNAVEVKCEMSELEEDANEGNATGGGEEQRRPSWGPGMNLQDKGRFSSSSFAETSLQCPLQSKQANDRMMKSVSGSEGSTLASFRCSTPPATRLKQSEAANADQQVYQHVQIHPGEKPYCCLVCGKPYSSSSGLRKHKRSHKGAKPHVCSECGKCFTDGRSLSSHMTVHTGEKPHCCPKCGKRFSQIRSLQIHTRIHTGEKPYCCSVCGKKFYDRSSLQKHTRVHTGEKPYCCSECGKRFSDSSFFRKHTRIHTGEKPYCCCECGKRFSDCSVFRKHTRIHTGEKPYCCSECGKRFADGSVFRKHTQIHTGLKP